MASLKEIKGRIETVISTQKITSAMKMIASAKLHRAQGAIRNMLPYEKSLNDIMLRLLSSGGELSSPYIEKRSVQRVAIIVFSSNTTLCGAFNSNVNKELTQIIDSYPEVGNESILIYPIGKQISKQVVRAGFTPQGDFEKLANKPDYNEASELAHKLMRMFEAEEIDKVELLYHHFISTGKQVLTRSTYLPLDLQSVKTLDAEAQTDYIIEPEEKVLIQSLIPKVLSLKVFTALLDSNASEHAARMMAMQTASDNARDLLHTLTVQYNKSRQQAITNELLDIVGASTHK
ncbi:MAG: F0F1 ATP synthase subunit gamma [Bacteroidales bacterium]|jgi:F-type H+-transporting ATPase subunit gamma|nr:F0F1 ATP synthase subunit gamma [Bacteroidales bacterium]